MQIYESKLIGRAAGAIDPISVDDAKDWASIDTETDNDLLGKIISSATEMVESFLSKDIVSKDRQLFVDEPEDSENTIILPYNAKDGTVVVNVDGTELTEDEDYTILGIGNKYIRLSNYGKNITISYTSDPISNNSELELVVSATKCLIEQVYDNRANLEGDSEIMVMDMNVKRMLNPIRTIYL
ncbi:MAG: phage head-tail connector protein [Flavobacteriaceae bacterium]|nr:phage head-tail connector protein [Flavobacteriaceae bacterium]